MENHYSIKIEKGDLKIEVSGSDKDFVVNNHKEMIKLVETSKIFKPEPITQQKHERENEIKTLEAKSQEVDSDDPIAKFANASGISVDELGNVYDFANGVFIHKPPSGSDAEKQKQIAKLALIANYYINSEEQLSGKAIGKYLENLGVGSRSNLAFNLKKESGIIKVKHYYKLNVLGRKEALEIVKRLATN